MYWLFRFFSAWPLAALHALGTALGWLVWLGSSRYRERFRAHAAQAGLPFAAVQPAIADAGRMVAELPRIWLRPRFRSCLGDVQVQGAEHADAALAQARGVIFFSAHGGSFELGPQALAELYGPVTALYRPARQAWLAKLQRMARDRPRLEVLPAGLSGIRQLLKALRAGQAIALLVDQVPPQGQGIWAPFFGKPAYTMTLAARLALQSGAAMLPVSCDRLRRGQGYLLQIRAPLPGLTGLDKDDLPTAVTLINQAIEKLILELPGQYLWAYGRYKAPRSPAGAGPVGGPVGSR